jgi:hypothetical protein
MDEVTKRRIKKDLVDFIHNENVHRYMLLSIDDKGRANIQYAGTTLEQNAFMLLMGQDLIKKLATGELQKVCGVVVWKKKLGCIIQ